MKQNLKSIEPYRFPRRNLSKKNPPLESGYYRTSDCIYDSLYFPRKDTPLNENKNLKLRPLSWDGPEVEVWEPPSSAAFLTEKEN